MWMRANRKKKTRDTVKIAGYIISRLRFEYFCFLSKTVEE